MTENDNHISIYPTPAIKELVGDPKHGLLPSGRISNVAERYLLIVTDELARLRFTRGEWCAILDANNGFEVEGNGSEFQVMWANVIDTPGLDAKWGVDCSVLAQRMQGLSMAAQAAIYEVRNIFWRNTDLPVDVALEKAGVKLGERAG
jgi:hypothetical protein